MPDIRRTLSSPRAQHLTRQIVEYAAVDGALWLQADRMGRTFPDGHKTRDLLVAAGGIGK